MTRTATVIEDLLQAMRMWARVLDAAELDTGDVGFDFQMSASRVKHFVGIGDACHWTKLRIKEWIGRVADLHQEIGAGTTEKHQPNGDLSPADAGKHSPVSCAGVQRVTAVQLAAWLEVEQAATPGPWFTEPAERLGGSVSATIDGLPRQVASADGQAGMFDRRLEPQRVLAANAAFIAAARTAVPALLEEVSRLRAEVDDLRTAVIGVATLQIRRFEDAEIVHAHRQVANDVQPFSLEQVETRIARIRIARIRSER